jgi:hypothetical protein
VKEDQTMNRTPRITHIKGIVEGAMRSLDDGDWSPAIGGEWACRFTGNKVYFQKATRFCPKVTYRVTGPELGVWVGCLNGASHRNIGKPVQNHTPEQIARFQGAPA